MMLVSDPVRLIRKGGTPLKACVGIKFTQRRTASSQISPVEFSPMNHPPSHPSLTLG